MELAVKLTKPEFMGTWYELHMHQSDRVLSKEEDQEDAVNNQDCVDQD